MPLAAGLVRQILINLLLNAIQATASGCEIRLNVELQASELVLQLANDGDPPPAPVLNRIFEPFVSGREGGHGLGLWVTYQTVQQLGGHIAIDTGDGKVIFRVRLPSKEAS
jgi:signal transduction histidine kinase